VSERTRDAANLVQSKICHSDTDETGQADSTSQGGAPVVAQEATQHSPGVVGAGDVQADPVALRSAAENARADAARESARLLADGEVVAEELERRAEQVEDERAEQAKVHGYLVAVEAAITGLSEAKDNYDALVEQVAGAERVVEEQRQRHRQAEAEAEHARQQLATLVEAGADLDELRAVRIDVASAESLLPMLYPQVQQAEAALAQQQQARERQAEAVAECWKVLERLQATSDIERPKCLPAPPGPGWDLTKLTREQWAQALLVLLWAAKLQQEEDERERAFRRGVAKRMLLPGEARPLLRP